MFTYNRDDIIRKLNENDDDFMIELLEYLKKIQACHIIKMSNLLKEPDFEEISQEVAFTVCKEYPNTEGDVPLDAFLRIAYKRCATDYLSQKTGISRAYWRIIRSVLSASEKYKIPVCRDNYYKFHRLTSYSIQKIDTAFEFYKHQECLFKKKKPSENNI